MQQKQTYTNRTLATVGDEALRDTSPEAIPEIDVADFNFALDLQGGDFDADRFSIALAT